MVERKIIAGIDIGGTNIRIAVAEVDDPASILARGTSRTPADTKPGSLADLIVAGVNECLDKARVSRELLVSVGCTAPGITDAASGVVISAANLPGWRNVPWEEILEKRFGTPTAIENDVRAAALGEFTYGAGIGSRSLVYMTISTGISAGIIVNGGLVRGHHHFAGEIAYLIPDPVHLGKDWGINGCLELTAAGVGIAKEWSTHHTGDVSAADVFVAARSGNETAGSIIARAGDYLAQAAIALCTVIDPQVLVIGGGIAENEPQFVERISHVVETTLPYPPEVVPAGLGKDSPLIGALALAAESAVTSSDTTAL